VQKRRRGVLLWSSNILSLEKGGLWIVIIMMMIIIIITTGHSITSFMEAGKKTSQANNKQELITKNNLLNIN
jgi:flagellar basal body-associated protein FliL